MSVNTSSTKADLLREIRDLNRRLENQAGEVERLNKQRVDLAREILEQGVEHGLCRDGLLGFVELNLGLDVAAEVNPEYVFTFTVTATSDEEFDVLCESIKDTLESEMRIRGAEDINEVIDATWWSKDSFKAYCKRTAES